MGWDGWDMCIENREGKSERIDGSRTKIVQYREEDGEEGGCQREQVFGAERNWGIEYLERGMNGISMVTAKVPYASLVCVEGSGCLGSDLTT